MLLQLRDHKCYQHVHKPFSCDRAGFESSWSHLFKKIRPNDECCGETAPYRNLWRMQGYLMDCARVFTFQNVAVVRIHLTVQVKMSLICPKDVPRPSSIDFHSGKKLLCKCFPNYEVPVGQLMMPMDFVRKITQNSTHYTPDFRTGHINSTRNSWHTEYTVWRLVSGVHDRQSNVFNVCRFHNMSFSTL